MVLYGELHPVELELLEHFRVNDNDIRIIDYDDNDSDSSSPEPDL